MTNDETIVESGERKAENHGLLNPLSAFRFPLFHHRSSFPQHHADPLSASKPRSVAAVIAVLLALGTGVFWLGGAFSDDALVVYCAHDALYSQQILDEFERQTGIKVAIQFDTEATKSLGLVNLLIKEKDHPRCDVFWNNEVLGTMQLQEAGVLEPYQGAGYERIPAGFKDPQGHWTGFAARLRVYIVNTEKMPATEAAIAERLQQSDLSRMSVAMPMYGTTLTHYSTLWHLWDGDKLKRWHHDLRKRGLQEVRGNAMSKNLVAAGTCDFGWTDTDDFFVAQDDGKPVAMLPVRVDDGKTICIPNSVAIIRGTKRRAAAEQLIDFLLSKEIELKLAKSKSRQIPLGPVDDDQLPEDVRELKRWAADGVDLTVLSPARKDCLAWLAEEYLETGVRGQDSGFRRTTGKPSESVARK